MNKEVYVKVVAGIAALGGLLFGYDTGVMSGALLFISPAFDMSAHQEGWVTSMLLVGAAVGALTAGRIADRFGRRLTLIAGGIIFVLGSVWCALSGSVGMLATARTFLGFAVGAVSIVSPMYIAEIVPAKVRGRMVSLNTLAIVVGQLMAYLVNSALASTGSWEWMLGLAAVPGLALALGMAFLPETPVWLATNGHMASAQEIAGRAGMDISELTSQETARKSSGSEWKALKANRWMQITVLLAMLMGLTQQITGVNAIVYFAPTMMNQVGISTANSVYTSIVIGTVSVLACCRGPHWAKATIAYRSDRQRGLAVYPLLCLFPCAGLHRHGDGLVGLYGAVYRLPAGCSVAHYLATHLRAGAAAGARPRHGHCGTLAMGHQLGRGAVLPAASGVADRPGGVYRLRSLWSHCHRLHQGFGSRDYGT